MWVEKQNTAVGRPRNVEKSIQYNREASDNRRNFSEYTFFYYLFVLHACSARLNTRAIFFFL